MQMCVRALENIDIRDNPYFIVNCVFIKPLHFLASYLECCLTIERRDKKSNKRNCELADGHFYYFMFLQISIALIFIGFSWIYKYHYHECFWSQSSWLKIWYPHKERKRLNKSFSNIYQTLYSYSLALTEKQLCGVCSSSASLVSGKPL